MRFAPPQPFQPRHAPHPCRPAILHALPQHQPRTSLIPDALQELQERPPERTPSEEARARRRALASLQLPSFEATLHAAGLTPLAHAPPRTLQLNIGLYCNQACTHCHVESSPLRVQEMMDRATADRCLELLRGALDTIHTLDLTGGAPELNSQFRYVQHVHQTTHHDTTFVTPHRHLVTAAHGMGVAEIVDRCNLTVLLEPGQEGLPAFLAEHGVRVVASLPCYGAANVDGQRGRGVFDRSIQVLVGVSGRVCSGTMINVLICSCSTPTFFLMTNPPCFIAYHP